jgi:hypothetical protein
MDDLDRAEWEAYQAEKRHDEAEYQRGINDTKLAQQMGPAGSAEREAAYRDMEAQWAKEGDDY